MGATGLARRGTILSVAILFATALPALNQEAGPAARVSVDPEDLHPPPGLNAFQVNARDEPVVGKAKGEPGVVVEWDHPAFFFNRISANLSRLVIALIAASRFRAKLRLA